MVRPGEALFGRSSSCCWFLEDWRRGAMNNLDFSNPVVIGVILAVVLVIVLAVVWVVTRQRQRRKTLELRARFGSEYDLALIEYGSRAKAEAALMERVN